MRSYRGPDGTDWEVEVTLPGSSNAMILFRHPDGRSSSMDRYNWILSHGPESRSVTARLTPSKVLAALDPNALDRLFRRSMPVSRTNGGAHSVAGT